MPEENTETKQNMQTTNAVLLFTPGFKSAPPHTHTHKKKLQILTKWGASHSLFESQMHRPLVMYQAGWPPSSLFGQGFFSHYLQQPSRRLKTGLSLAVLYSWEWNTRTALYLTACTT